MARGAIGQEELELYRKKGFVLVRGMFDAEEIGLLRAAAKEDRAIDEHSFSRADGEGGNVRLSLWNHPGDGIYGMFARCRSVVPPSSIQRDRFARSMAVPGKVISSRRYFRV